MTYKEEFITFMVRSGVLTFGDFTTKSGRKTPYFVNTGNYKTGAQAASWGTTTLPVSRSTCQTALPACSDRPTRASPGGICRRLPVPQL